MYDSNKSSFAEYILMERNTQNKFSGEFFIFRNPSYTGSTTNLKFGINDWQFSSGNQFTPNPADSRVYSNVKLTSNIKFGATAIWTGLSGIDSRIEFFNRQNDLTLESYSVPRLYSEISGTNSPELNSGLFAWWDMDISDTSPYSVSASNNQNLKIYLSGEYTGSIDSSETNLITSSETKNPSSSLFGLPFGGFPGTDRYGR
jgi:hypothetical protein